MSKKSKTIDLGKVRKFDNGGASFNFDSSITGIEITREYETKDGEKVIQKLNVMPNDKGYFNSNINKVEDYVGFRLGQGWIDETQAEAMLNGLKDANYTTVFSVKVES